MSTNNNHDISQTFSEPVLSALNIAGWFSGRVINIDECVSALQSAGFTVCPVVHDFLSEFGGLEIRRQIVNNSPNNIGHTLDYIHGNLEFDPSWCADNIHPENVEYYIQMLGKQICVVGVWEGVTLFMSCDGAVYGSFGSDVYFFGSTGREAIENILVGNTIKIRKWSIIRS